MLLRQRFCVFLYLSFAGCYVSDFTFLPLLFRLHFRLLKLRRMKNRRASALLSFICPIFHGFLFINFRWILCFFAHFLFQFNLNRSGNAKEIRKKMMSSSWKRELLSFSLSQNRIKIEMNVLDNQLNWPKIIIFWKEEKNEEKSYGKNKFNENH